jgi:hypothetical protein
MVGRVTLLIPTIGRPAMRSFGPEVSTFSGPATGWGSGAALGQMGIWVWPGDGCQTGFCAERELNASKRETATMEGFMAIPKDSGIASQWLYGQLLFV